MVKRGHEDLLVVGHVRVEAEFAVKLSPAVSARGFVSLMYFADVHFESGILFEEFPALVASIMSGCNKELSPKSKNCVRYIFCV